MGELGGVLSLLPVNPSQCPFVQMTDTDVAFLLCCRSCPCDRHDLYLPSILSRCECAAASALAPHGLRIISPLTFYLNLLRAIWTFDTFSPTRSFRASGSAITSHHSRPFVRCFFPFPSSTWCVCLAFLRLAAPALSLAFFSSFCSCILCKFVKCSAGFALSS